ncbi:hypothetical protein Tco_0068202 [Tanacetum coccineum]
MFSGHRPTTGFRPPPRRRCRKTFSANFSGRIQKGSSSPDPPCHAPPLATTRLSITTTSTTTATITLHHTTTATTSSPPSSPLSPQPPTLAPSRVRLIIPKHHEGAFGGAAATMEWVGRLPPL